MTFRQSELLETLRRADDLVQAAVLAPAAPSRQRAADPLTSLLPLAAGGTALVALMQLIARHLSAS